MKTYIAPGDVCTLIAPYDRLSGQGALVGSLFGIAATDVLNGVAGEFAIVGVFSHQKTASQAWTAGSKIYWENKIKRFPAAAAQYRRLKAEIVPMTGGDMTDKVRTFSCHAPTVEIGPDPDQPRRRRRKPSVGTMIKQAEKVGKNVASITTPD